MNKDFDRWNIEKKNTHNSQIWHVFYEREVWWCVVGVNVGVEIDGKHELYLRPVIILRKFNKEMAIVVPTTTQDKANRYYLKVAGDDGKNYNSCLSQLRTISSKRLVRKIGTISNIDYFKLIDEITMMIKGNLKNNETPSFGGGISEAEAHNHQEL